MGTRSVTLTRTVAALLAAGLIAAAGSRALALVGSGGGAVAAPVALAAALVLLGALDRRPVVCGAGALLSALVYVLAVWRAGGDGAAPLVGAALLGGLELARLAGELPAGVSGRRLRRRLAEIVAAAAAAAGVAWLVLAAGSAHAPGGIVATAAGLAVTVAAVAMVVRLGRA